jgi:molybdopterin-guanine dinucleotide biosynthesis protein A
MTEISSVLLAGGLARRMGGGDKPMRVIAGKTILERVISRLRPQCGGLILNANGDPTRFAQFGLPVIADNVADFPGPLAGILAGLDWVAANRPDVNWMLSAAGDCPFLPRNLVARLDHERREKNAELAVAASGGQTHPVIGLWSVRLREELRQALVAEGFERSIGGHRATPLPPSPGPPLHSIRSSMRTRSRISLRPIDSRHWMVTKSSIWCAKASNERKD